MKEWERGKAWWRKESGKSMKRVRRSGSMLRKGESREAGKEWISKTRVGGSGDIPEVEKVEKIV